MYDRMQTLTKEQMTRIHDGALNLLKNTGVGFIDVETLEIFKANGFKVDGKTVFFQEKDIAKALETAPEKFTVVARDPDKSVRIGGDDFVFLPGYGAPFLTLPDGEQREATLADYDNFCKLIQTSKYIDMNGFMMVEPSDVPAETAHLDMLFSNIVLSDKPFLGSPLSRRAIIDCIEMCGMVWGGKEKLKEMPPVTVSLINSLSPLQFSEEMAGSLIELARNGQAVVVASLIMAGASGPVTLAGVLALQTAEILAGITLAQIVNPGTPVIYGSTSSAMDMKSGALTIGAPELSMISSATAQMARFYNLPSRSGGGLTDALFTDAQAGSESTFSLLTSVRNGINFILHSAGIMGSYISMSFEKFITDEEICGMVRHLMKPIDITDASIDLDVIKEVGIGGQYLSHPKTFELCRTAFFAPDLNNRFTYDAWKAKGSRRIDEIATDMVGKRLATYEKPDIDRDVEAALSDYVTKRKNM